MKKIRRLEVTYLDGTRLMVEGIGQITDITTRDKAGTREWQYVTIVFTPREIGK
jgi:hypothetical protein